MECGMRSAECGMVSAPKPERFRQAGLLLFDIVDLFAPPA
jgi:hypothetical protein